MISNVQFTIDLSSGNDAVVSDPQAAIKRVLEDISSLVESGHDEGNIRDLNGNKIGAWFFDIDTDDDDED